MNYTTAFETDSGSPYPLSASAFGDLTTIMQRVSALLANVLEGEFCTLFIYDETSTETIAAYRWGHDLAGVASASQFDAQSPWDVPIEAEVIRTRTPIQRWRPEDFERWPIDPDQEDARKGMTCDVLIPLVSHDIVHGVGFVWRRDAPGPFSNEKIDAACEIAEMGAMAIDFSRQHAQELRRGRQLDTLLDVATLVSTEQDLDDVLPVLARAIRSGIGADAVHLYVFDPQGHHVFAEFIDGMTELEQRLFADGHEEPWADVSAKAQVRRTLAPVIVEDFVRDLDLSDAVLEYIQSENIRELLLVPLVHQQQVLGLIYCWHRGSGQRFANEAVTTAFAIASQASAVVSRSRLRELTQQQALESEALLRIGQAVLTSDSLEPVLDQIAETLGEMIPYDHCFIGLLNSDGSALRIIREWGPISTGMRDQELPLHGSLTGWVVGTGEIVNIPDKFVDPRTKQYDLRSITRLIRSVLIAPLTTEHGTIGALFLGREPAGVFPRHQERLLSLLAQHAALAIERMQARDSLRRQAERQAFLASVIEKLVAHDTPDEVIPEIAEMATGVLADGVMIGLAEWEYGRVTWSAISHNNLEIESRLKAGIATLESEALRERFENVLTSQQIFVFGPDRIWPEHAFVRDFVEYLGIHELLVVPLFRPERARGMMILCNNQPNQRFSSDEIELARIVGHRIGDALERQQMNRNRDALLRVAEAMHEQSNLEDILGTIMHELDWLVPYDFLMIAEPDFEAQVWRMILYRSQDDLLAQDREFPLSDGICGEVFRSRIPVFDNEADLRPTTRYSDDVKEYFEEAGESAMVAPLITDDELIGVVFHSRRGRHRLTTSDFETFLLFAGLAAAAIDHTSLVEHNRRLYRASVEVLAAVVDAKDPYTLEHSRHVAHYSGIAAELMELPTEEVERIELAGLMHDIGKLGIPDHILTKPGRLTDAERELINTHPDRGARILMQHPALTSLVPLVRHHHERIDGKGYPDGLAGDDIPIGASIIGVADAFDTMTSQRTYQRRKTVEDALVELERCAGTQFHPEVVTRFVSAIRAAPRLLYLAPVE